METVYSRIRDPELEEQRLNKRFLTGNFLKLPQIKISINQ